MKKTDKVAMKIYTPIFTALTLIIISVIAVYTKMDQKDKSIVDSFEIAGKQVYQSACGERAEESIKNAKDSAVKLNMKISLNTRDSQIQKINEGAGKTWVKCDEEIIDIIKRSKDMSKQSLGVLDITSGKLIDLWSTGIKNFKPSDQDLKRALIGINYNFININNDVNRVKLMSSSSKINLESIKDGAVCETMIKVYGEMDADYGIASVGNTTGVYKLKPESKHWKLSVKDKIKAENNECEVAIINVKDGYMCTLMNEFFNNKSLKLKGSPLIDLRTGYPKENNLSSVTILHSDAIIANGLAHICSVMDKNESDTILKAYKAGAVFIYKDKSVFVTDNIKDDFIILNKEYILKN